MLILSILLLWLVPLNNYGHALLMCGNFIWILHITWKTERMTPYFFFLATFTILFIGGRFWTELLIPNTYSMRRGNFFDETLINRALWCRSLTYILVFLYYSTLTYINYPREYKNKPILCYERKKHLSIDWILIGVLCIIAPFVLYDVGCKLLMVFTSEDGYLSLYKAQTQHITPGSGIVSSLLYVFFGIAMLYGNDRIKKLFMLLMFAKSFAFILIGQRAKFGAFMLFFLWFYMRKRKASALGMGVLAVASFFILVFITTFSAREATGACSSVPFAGLGRFLYAQGVSLTTFTFSQQIESYPTLPYFVSFFPGVASLVSLITPLPPQEASFAAYLAYTLNETKYLEGHGLGWTFLSDLYLYSGRTFEFFAFFSVLFGFICAYVEDKSKTNPFAAVVVYTTFLNLTFLPRAGMYTILPLLVWLGCIYVGIDKLSYAFQEAQTFEANKQTQSDNPNEEQIENQFIRKRKI